MKTGMPNTVQSFAYIKYYKSSSPRAIKSPSNSITYNCRKICSLSRGTETKLKITIFDVINKPIIYRFFKDFATHRKETNRVIVFSYRPLPNGPTDNTVQQSGKHDSFRDKLKRSASIRINVQTHSSS